MQTVFGYFEDFDDARSTVAVLQARGFNDEQMNVVVSEDAAKNFMNVDEHEVMYEKSEQVGHVTVSGIASLLGGLQPVQTPDLGEVYATGNLADIMARAVAAPGNEDKNFKTALMDFDLPEETAEAYEKALKEGSVLLFLRVPDERSSTVSNLMRENHGARVASYP